MNQWLCDKLNTLEKSLSEKDNVCGLKRVLKNIRNLEGIPKELKELEKIQTLDKDRENRMDDIKTRMDELKSAMKIKLGVMYDYGNTDYVVPIRFIDDGEGLSDKYKAEDYFNAGISTTRRGSGMGLSHIKQIVEELEGNVSLSSNKDSGATLKVWWEK